MFENKLLLFILAFFKENMVNKLDHTAWYEVILDQTKLDKELATDSLANKVELLNRLLYQIHQLFRVQDLPAQSQETSTKKRQDIQCACLKIFSELKWNVSLLVDNIQPFLVDNLVNYMIRFTKGSEVKQASIDEDKDGNLNAAQSSLILWHLWVVLAWLRGVQTKAGVKPKNHLPMPKLAVTVVSGLTNPVTILVDQNKASNGQVERELVNSLSVLSKLEQRRDIKTFTLPKTSAFMLLSESNDAEKNPFIESNCATVEWDLLRSKIAYCLLHYNVAISNYSQLPSLISTLSDSPVMKKINENFESLVVEIDKALISSFEKLAENFQSSRHCGSEILKIIIDEGNVKTAYNRIDQNIPSTFFLTASQDQKLTESNREGLQILFVACAIREQRSSSFIVDSLPALRSNNLEGFFDKLMNLFEEQKEGKNPLPLKNIAEFLNHFIVTTDPSTCSRVLKSRNDFLRSSPDFNETVRLVECNCTNDDDVEMANVDIDDGGNQFLPVQALLQSPIEQLRSVFTVEDIEAAVINLKPVTIDDFVQMWAFECGLVPRRLLTILGQQVNERIPHACFTLAYIVKAKQLMKSKIYPSALTLLKNAQERSQALPPKIHNYATCLLLICNFEMGSPQSTNFSNAADLIKNIRTSGDMETLDSSDFIKLYVHMVSYFSSLFI